MKAEASASIAAVDDLRKRIAAEAEIIVQETMPRKVLFPSPLARRTVGHQGCS